jgi:hypothetical protein
MQLDINQNAGSQAFWFRCNNYFTAGTLKPLLVTFIKPADCLRDLGIRLRRLRQGESKSQVLLKSARRCR